jgi:hypothetical protein
MLIDICVREVMLYLALITGLAVLQQVVLLQEPNTAPGALHILQVQLHMLHMETVYNIVILLHMLFSQDQVFMNIQDFWDTLLLVDTGKI